MLQKNKTLRGLTLGAAAILMLVAAIHIIMIIFPQIVLEKYNASPYVIVGPAMKALLIFLELKYIVIAGLALWSGIRKDFSFVFGIVTMIVTALSYIFPGRLGEMLINQSIARYSGAAIMGSYSAMRSFMGSFSAVVILAVGVLISCTAIEIYAARKLNVENE